jgi:hypothetical protein
MKAMSPASSRVMVGQAWLQPAFLHLSSMAPSKAASPCCATASCPGTAKCRPLLVHSPAPLCNLHRILSALHSSSRSPSV